jgi:hypothetical protein
MGAGVALASSHRLGARAGVWAGAFALLDLVIVNGSINQSVPRAFYDLRPSVRSLVDSAGPGRWFSYGIATSPGLHWDTRVIAANSDKVLYGLDRQSLWARAKTLDGLDGAFDEDRTAWAPPGSTLQPSENSPALFRRHYGRLRHAAVRWALSFHPLPPDLTDARGSVQFPELAEPLTLYELRDALPRAFWVRACEVEPDPSRRRARLESPSFDPRRTVLLDREPPGGSCAAGAAGPEGTVRWKRSGPHTVSLASDGAAGYLVVIEGLAPAWEAESAGVRLPILRANERYWAIPTGGGPMEISVRYRPGWRAPTLASLALGTLIALILLFSRRLRLTEAPAGC